MVIIAYQSIRSKFSERNFLYSQKLEVGLKGGFLCTKVFGQTMIKQNKGVILNISSDLGIISPNQNLYKIANHEKYNVDYYSLQIYNGNYKEADSIFKFSKKFFISDSVYLFYETPNYKVQLGKYWDKLKAQKKLKEIQKKFKSAFILKPKGI